MTSASSFIRYALSIGAIELVPEGRKLKSGRVSPYFFNSGLFNTGRSVVRLARAYSLAIDEKFHPDPDVIFGPAYKGVAIAVAVVQIRNDDTGYAYNRKEAKPHGEEGIIIGAPLQDKRVLIVDDVMTTGDSCREALNIIRAAGGIPVGCLVAFDRQERGSKSSFSAVQEFENNERIRVHAVATLADLIEVLELSQDDHTFLALRQIHKYQKQWGV